MVMFLVSVLDIAQDIEGLTLGCWLDKYFLESSFQCSVLLDALSIFVDGRGTDTLYGTPCKGWLHDVGCVHAARRAACSNHGVYLVDEYYYVRILLQFAQQGLDSLLKLSTIFRSCYHGRHVKTYYPLAEKYR